MTTGAFIKVRLLTLTLAVFARVSITAGADLATNQLWIGDTAVETKVVDGKLVGQRVIGQSDSLVIINVELTPLEAPINAPEMNPSSKDDTNPSLRLMLGDGDKPGPIGNVKGLHGLICMANDWRTPGLGRTTPVDIYSTADKTRIVVMVRDNGPIYSSTNSGMTWTTINMPGEYQFALTSWPDGGGFFVEATIHPSPENQTTTNSLASSWYSIGFAPDGSGLVMSGDSSQPAPVLSITQSNAGIVVSWSAAFGGFTLQANSDFNTTNWVNITNSVNLTGNEHHVFISSPTGNKFYRLRTQ